MKSTSHGIVSLRIRSAMKKTAPLRTPISSRTRPSKSAELSPPSSAIRALRASLSIRTSPTALSSSVCDTLGPHFRVLDDARDGDDLAAPDDERPCLPLRPGNLGVYEHVLDLLPPAGEP